MLGGTRPVAVAVAVSVVVVVVVAAFTLLHTDARIPLTIGAHSVVRGGKHATSETRSLIMIGCILFGAAMLGFAAAARRRHIAWMRFQHHGYGYGGQGWCGGGYALERGCGSWRGVDPDLGGDHHRGFDAGRGGFFGADPFESRTGRAHLLRRILRRVETTPTQERAIEGAFVELSDSVKPLRAEAKRSRADLAAAMRRTSLDEVALGEMFARHDRLAEDIRKAFVGFLARVHEILDDIQRERFASLLEKGWFRGMTFASDGEPSRRDNPL